MNINDNYGCRKGEIMTFAETKCPCCGHGGSFGTGTAFAVQRIWNGSRWVLLDSFEGKQVALDNAFQETMDPPSVAK